MRILFRGIQRTEINRSEIMGERRDMVTNVAIFIGNRMEVPKLHSIAVTLWWHGHHIAYKLSAIFVRHSYKIEGHFHDLVGHLVMKLDCPVKREMVGRSVLPSVLHAPTPTLYARLTYL